LFPFYLFCLLFYYAQGTRVWATYCGGASYENMENIATDKSGNVYVAGWTNSTNGIDSAGAFQTTHGGGNNDAYLVKYSPSGTRLWGTYYGGSSDDYGYGVATDIMGNVFLTGYTSSSNLPMPAALVPIATGPFWAGTVIDAGGGTVPWINPSNTSGSATGTYAVTGSLSGGAISNYLQATNFTGISVPAGDVITGVVVDWKSSGTVAADNKVYLVKGGVIQSGATNQTINTAIGTTQTTRTYGSSTDSWGIALTKADVEASNFGVVIACTKAGGGSPRVGNRFGEKQ
jgi:hypothetical protein